MPTEITVSRFKPSGKWYEDFKVTVSPSIEEIQDPKTAPRATFQAHLEIREKYKAHNDPKEGWFWHHDHADMFPCLLTPLSVS